MRSPPPVSHVLAAVAALVVGIGCIPALAHDAMATPTGCVSSGYPSEDPFLTENDAAMTKMMAAMAVSPTGDVDRDFVAMMAPHHQGAIDMSLAVLRHGHNERLKRLAQEIIVTQQQEIAAMKLAVGDRLPASVAAPTQPETLPVAAGGCGGATHSAMTMNRESGK